MNLQKTKHPIPYKVSWLQNGLQLLVSEQFEIKIQIRNYKDKVVCDVMHMDVVISYWVDLSSMTRLQSMMAERMFMSWRRMGSNIS